jgi:glycosyltransferase involved in cell wall biosynthesis
MAYERPQPLFAIVSTNIRRDLVAPVRHFTRLRIVHFYRKASYGDLAPGDLDGNLIAYRNPIDLFRRLQGARPDIVQGVEYFSIRQLPYQAAVYFHARFQRVVLVAAVHISRPLTEKYGYIAAWLLKLILQPALRFTGLFFYLNGGGRRNLLWMGVPQTKLVRHMYGTWGVDLDEFTPVRDGREPEWGTTPVLLFVGRVHFEKGIFDLLTAYGRVRDVFHDARLVVIGDGPHRREAEKVVRERGWRETVRFLGAVKHRDLPPYFRTAALCASPAISTRKWEEYVGMTNIQAMACGVPVVSTVSGAIPEYVPDGVAGILVPDRSPAALAAAICRLLSDDRMRRQMGAAGRAHAVARYDATKAVIGAEDILLELLERERQVQ